MKSLSRYSFFTGILLFIIYERSFYLLLSLNELCLFILEMSEGFYVGGFAISIILSNLTVFGLYKLYVKSENHRLLIIGLIITLTIIVLMSLGVNYYLGSLGSSEIKKPIQDLYFKYYDYKNIVYFINTAILVVLYGYIFFKKKVE